MRNYQKLFFDGFLLTKRKAVMSNSISYSKLVKKGYKRQNLKINCKSEKLLLITIVNNLSFQFLVNKLCKKIALCSKIHCVKSVQILSFFWSVFSSIRTECECWKIRTKKNSVFRHISHSTILQILGKTQTEVFPISGFLINPF